MRNGKPFVVDGYCGLGAWSEAFISEGWECVGIDIEAHDYGNGGYPGTLILRDMLTVNGAEFKDADCFVFSPPCQAYSYMSMPWSKAKQMRREYLEGKRDRKELTALFDACFRIQREASSAAGHYIPMIIENVRGAQEWVGRSKAHFGSFHLWGDVPALMPIPKFTRIAGQQAGVKVPSKSGHRTAVGKGARFTSRDCGVEGSKHTFTKNNPKGLPRILPNVLATGSKSNARKQASAEIAKIPPALASWIAKCFKPKSV